MNARPGLDRLEQLLARHNGACAQPCDGCDLAAEVVAMHRLVQFISTQVEGIEPPEIPGRGLPDKRD